MKGKGPRIDPKLNERILLGVGAVDDIAHVNGVTDYLRNKYPEYRRIKYNPFAKQVGHSLEYLHGSGKLEESIQSAVEGRESDSEEDEDADEEDKHVIEEPHVAGINLNGSLTSMYGKKKTEHMECTTPGESGPGTTGMQQNDPSEVSTPGKPHAEVGEDPPVQGVDVNQKKSRRKSDGTSGARPKRLRSAETKKKGSTLSTPKAVTYADLGGIEDVLKDITQLIEYPLRHPEVYSWLGVEPPRGILLYGPPGCGKTALANAIANECGVPFLRISAPEVVAGMSGESEANLRQIFAEAAACAPSILFIDEIDAIAPKRESAQREMERRIVAQMLTCMDDLSQPQAEATDEATGLPIDGGTGSSARAGDVHKHVVVIGATNRPDALDSALRRAGRFDREIALGIPSEAAREKILQVLCRSLRLSGDFNFKSIARSTPGYVGADLTALTKEAAAFSVARIFDQLQQPDALDSNPMVITPPDHLPQDAPNSVIDVPLPTQQVRGVGSGETEAGGFKFGEAPLTMEQLHGLAITMNDFEAAVKKVQPSVRREGFSTTPDACWSDIGALHEIREELTFAITEPIRNPEAFLSLGLNTASGVLLFGPPGCGKTLVAKAAAHESGANFISIKGPELLNKYVGESERAVRQLFQRARAAHPCVLFFDEMDALAPRRGGSDNNHSSERVVNQLLTEIDGTESRQGVYIIAATNRPDIIDPALLRPGRLDKTLYVPLPEAEGRVSILQALTRETPMAADVDLVAVGNDSRCTGFSGADMASIVREAAVLCIKETMKPGQISVSNNGKAEVAMKHFTSALIRILPSVSAKDQRSYQRLRNKLTASRSHINDDVAEAQIPVTALDGPAHEQDAPMDAD